MASSDGKATRAVMRLSPPDNVAVELRHLKAGETVMLDGVALKGSRNIAVGHIARGTGNRQGRNYPQVQLPDRHGHAGHRARRVRAHAQRREQLPPDVHLAAAINLTLQGYLRADGRKGIRNIVVVAYLVECAHHVARVS